MARGTPARGAIVLAGGRSERMGREKATLPFAGETLLAHVVRRVAPLVSEVVVVGRPGQSLPPLAGAAGAARLVLTSDEIEGLGPLAGLAAGLRVATAPVCLLVPCDVPFLVPAFVEALFAALGDADAAVPTTGEFVHPLPAVYRRVTLCAAESLLGDGQRRPMALLDRVPHVRVPEAVLRAADPELLSLLDCDTPEDYAAALRRLEVGRPG